jgi:hypothetical protein
MPLDDGSDFDWSQLPQGDGDPMAGSVYEDVQGQAPLESTQTPGLNDTGELPPGQSPQNPDKASAFINQLLSQLSSKGAAGTGMQQLLSALKNKGTNGLADLGSTLGAFSSGEKANRVTQGNFTQGYDKLMLDAQAARNATESDAMKKLAQTSYLMNGGSKFTGTPALSLNGKTYGSQNLGYGPSAASDAQKAGASSLQSQLQARLSPGGTYTPQPLSDYAKPGAAENVGSYGAVGTSGLGAVLNAFGLGGAPRPPQGQPTSEIVPTGNQ